jgi:hypothetical protein
MFIGPDLFKTGCVFSIQTCFFSIDTLKSSIDSKSHVLVIKRYYFVNQDLDEQIRKF